MAKIEIRHKCIMVAREAARKGSCARETGWSVFIKRCYGSYRLIGVVVSDKQRSCRDLFAEAQRLASRELKDWNKRRHWGRMAKRHKVRGAHRMAVSWFYRLLKESGGAVNEASDRGIGNIDHKVIQVGMRFGDEGSRMSWERRNRRRGGVARRRRDCEGELVEVDIKRSDKW